MSHRAHAHRPRAGPAGRPPPRRAGGAVHSQLYTIASLTLLTTRGSKHIYLNVILYSDTNIYEKTNAKTCTMCTHNAIHNAL